MVALGAADFQLGAQHFLGDALCLASMVLLAMYMALGRKNRDFPSIWVYVVPLYFVGGCMCMGVSLFFVRPPGIASAQGLLMTLGLIVVPTIIGHSIMNYSMKHIRGQTVSLVNLGQFIFAGIMGYLLLTKPEVPDWTFYLAAVLVVCGSVVASQSGSW